MGRQWVPVQSKEKRTDLVEQVSARLPIQAPVLHRFGQIGDGPRHLEDGVAGAGGEAKTVPVTSCAIGRRPPFKQVKGSAGNKKIYEATN